MPETLTVLLDQNVPRAIAHWLRARRARSFPIGSHAGIIRLRVWPTTIEETQDALERLIGEVPDAELAGALVIIDRESIRIRRGR